MLLREMWAYDPCAREYLVRWDVAYRDADKLMQCGADTRFSDNITLAQLEVARVAAAKCLAAETSGKILATAELKPALCANSPFNSGQFIECEIG